LSDQKLTDPLLVIRGVSQKAGKRLGEILSKSDFVHIKVSPLRPFLTSALILHAVLAQRGFAVATSAQLQQQNSEAVRRGEARVELAVTNRGVAKSATLALKSEEGAERYTLPFNQATQLALYLIAEEISVPTDEMRLLATASVLQHELVPQDQDAVAVLKGMGVRNVSSKSLSLSYSKGFTIVESLTSTLKPFIPGVSLEDPERVASELSARGVDPGYSVHDLDEAKLKQVISYVLEKISTHTRAPVQLSKVIPSVYASESVGRRDYDLRVVAGMLDVLVEVSPLSIVASAAARDVRVLEASFNLLADRLRAWVKAALQPRSLVVSGARVAIMEGAAIPLPLSYLKDNLAAFGVLQPDDALLVRGREGLLANCFELFRPLRVPVRIVSQAEGWCFYRVESEELAKLV